MQQNGSGGIVLVPDGSTWKYFKGTKEPSTPQAAWRQLGFNDSAWLSGPAAIGYGEAFIATNLADMRGSYTSLYLRKTFDVADLAAFDKLILEVKYDDGVNVWINGKLAYQDNVAGENLPYTALATSRHRERRTSCRRSRRSAHVARRGHERDRRPGPQLLPHRQLRLLHRRASDRPEVRPTASRHRR